MHHVATFSMVLGGVIKVSHSNIKETKFNIFLSVGKLGDAMLLLAVKEVGMNCKLEKKKK